MSKTVYLDAPNIGKLEKRYLDRAIDSGYVSVIGPYVSEFEKCFAGYLGLKDAASTQSGTAALHIALHELGIGAGDEVIVPALTFVASVNPVSYVGARPVFVDVDVKTWNISARSVEEHITKKTKAIIPVHLYGNPCEMKALLEIAKKNKLYVIEDATESLGATYKNRHTGTFGDLGCFSFNGNKIITTGGGGMLVGKDAKRLKHIKFLVNQARSEKDAYDYPEIGFNYRMTNIEAALGLAQMQRLGGFLEKKKAFNNIYRKELKSAGGIRFQESCPEAKSSYWLSCVAIDKKINIAALQAKLKKQGVLTRRIFRPVTEFAPYRGFKHGNYENAQQIYEKGLCLPSSVLNSEEDIYYVCRILKNTLRG